MSRPGEQAARPTAAGDTLPGEFLEPWPAARVAWQQWLRGRTIEVGDASTDDAEGALVHAIHWLAAGDPLRAAALLEPLVGTDDRSSIIEAFWTGARWAHGDPAARHETLQLAVELDERGAEPGLRGLAWYLAAASHAGAGDHETVALAARQLARATAAGAAPELPVMAATLVAGTPARGQRPATIPDLATAREQARSAGWARLLVRCLLAESWGALESGDPGRARIRIEGALLHGRRLPRDGDRAAAAALAARLRLRSGDLPGARAVVERPRDWFRVVRAPTWGPGLVRSALLVAARGSDADAARDWNRVMRLLHHAGRLPDEAMRVEAEALHAHARGQAAAAREHAVRSRRLWELAGMPEEADVLEQVVEAGHSVLATHVALTPRERQVAVLVASGMTNAAVAEHLQVSVRTAEHHVASILGKLGIGSRHDLAQLERAARGA